MVSHSVRRIFIGPMPTLPMDLVTASYLWEVYDRPPHPPHSEISHAWQLWRFLTRRYQGAVLLGAIALLLSNSPIQAAQYPGEGMAYIAPTAGFNVNIRSGPGTEYGAVNTLSRGTAIDITGRYENGWAELESGNWVAGYLIDSNPVARATNPGSSASNRPASDLIYTAYIATPVGYNLNIRSGPSTANPAVNTLRRGTAIAVNGGYTNGWAQLADGNWAAGNWVRVDSATARSRSAAATESAASPQTESAPPTNPASMEDTGRSGYLQRGSRGDAVRSLQQRLRELNYLSETFTPDGVFGDSTVLAVRQFQQINDLFVDGVAGPTTLGRLYGTAVANPVNPPSVIAAPSPSPAVTPTPSPDRVDSSSPRNGRIATDDGQDALLFSGPGTEYNLLRTIDSDTPVRVTGRTQNGWSELEDGSWVYAEWLDF